jgi:hypothetical protein
VAVLRIVEPVEPAVLVADPVEIPSGRLFAMLNGALSNELRPRFDPRPDKRLEPVSAEMTPDPDPDADVVMV